MMVGSNNSILNDKYLPVLFGLGIIFALLILMIRIVFLTIFVGDKVLGTYCYEDVKLTLKKNGICELISNDNIETTCRWKNNLDKIAVRYSYKFDDSDDYIEDSFSFVYSHNKLISNDIIFKKEKAIK